MQPTNRPALTAEYSQTRFDISEGRDWLVTTAEGHAYIVTIWHEEALGRMASCRCRAFTFGQLCRHIRYAQAVDSLLTGEPARAIRPVYESAEVIDFPMPAAAEDRLCVDRRA